MLKRIYLVKLAIIFCYAMSTESDASVEYAIAQTVWRTSRDCNPGIPGFPIRGSRKFSNPEIQGFSRTQSRNFGINKIYVFNGLLLVQNHGLNLGIQSRDPGIGIFQSRNSGIGKEFRGGNPYALG